MFLQDDEKAMLDGKMGPAPQKAMDLLCRYAKALGAERFVDVHNVLGGYMGASVPLLKKYGSFDALISQFCLDSDETVPMCQVRVPTCQNSTHMEADYYKLTGKTDEEYEVYKQNERFIMDMGLQWMATCTPYLLGNTPLKGEHVAWMESSAVVYINSVLGARTNCEGKESTTAAMLTGKIPYWGYHITENRRGTHLVEIACDVKDNMDWGLLGYYIGKTVLDKVPVVTGVKEFPHRDFLKHFGAASAASGGVELYHIPGITAESNTVQEAFGGNTPAERIVFDQAAKREAYDRLNFLANDRHVDFVILGCPNYSYEELWTLSKKLQGKRIKSDVQLWIFVPQAFKAMAERNGILQTIEASGALVMRDSCPFLGKFIPKGARVMATDSAKQAHYFPNQFKMPTWYGSMDDCVNAALTGVWEGEFK